MLHNTVVTKHWMAKWPYITSAVFRIVQIMVNKVTSVSFRREATVIA